MVPVDQMVEGVLYLANVNASFQAMRPQQVVPYLQHLKNSDKVAE